jgi:hypothetical protein
VRFSNQGLSLWYGTADAPAPLDCESERRRISVTVAVQPPNPSNAVTVRYRVDGGLLQTVRAVKVRTDYERRVEYHCARFPDFRTGQQVDYLPILTCAGRSAPDPAAAPGTYMSSFRLADCPENGDSVVNDPANQRVPQWRPAADRLPFSLDYLASVHVPMKEPETIGVTPEGIVVNWFWAPAEGIVIGPRLNAKVRQIGGDWMTIRRDGVGLMDVRATLETEDGALISVSYLGYYELGENGYDDFLAHRWPEHAPTRTTPRFRTAHPRYLWINRLQCVGIGQVRMKELSYTYDLYAVR